MSIRKKVKVLVLLLAITVGVGITSNTYSRYVVDATGNIDIMFANWQIFVNQTDITANSETSITFEPIMHENEHVANNVMAPTSEGHFDINIDPTNVDVSFKYLINFVKANENMPDVKIKEYAIVPKDYQEGNTLEFTPVTGDEIVAEKILDKSKPFEPFTIRVVFEWFDGEGELMNDEADTALGLQAATEDVSFKVNATIKFEQILSSSTEEQPENGEQQQNGETPQNETPVQEPTNENTEVVTDEENPVVE